MKWECVKFSELYECPSRNGLTRPSRVRGNGYKMINMGELFAHDRIHDIHMELVPMSDKERREYFVADGDLLFARQSLVLEGAGKCSIIMDSNGETTYESHLIRVRLKQNTAYSLFYYYYFRSSLSKIKSIVQQGVQAGIRASELSELQVHFPPFATQHRIADILSAYDDLIENNRKQIKLLEEAAQRLYKEWFVDLRFPGWETTPVVDGLPEGWTESSFGQICRVVKDTIKPAEKENGIPYIGLEHIPRFDFCLSEWGDSASVDSNKFRFKSDDILFGKIRPYFHKVGFALCDGIASTDALVFRTTSDLWALLLMCASSDAFVDYSYQTCKEGAKMPRADWNTMKVYNVLIADKNTLAKFSKSVWNITRQVKARALQNRCLIQARDALLPKLMSGELEV